MTLNFSAATALTGGRSAVEEIHFAESRGSRLRLRLRSTRSASEGTGSSDYFTSASPKNSGECFTPTRGCAIHGATASFHRA